MKLNWYYLGYKVEEEDKDWAFHTQSTQCNKMFSAGSNEKKKTMSVAFPISEVSSQITFITYFFM